MSEKQTPKNSDIDKAQEAVDNAAANAAAAKELADKAEAEATKPKAKAKGGKVYAVFGDMIDSETGYRYTSQPTDIHKDNGWLKMQIDAGKIAYVE